MKRVPFGYGLTRVGLPAIIIIIIARKKRTVAGDQPRGHDFSQWPRSEAACKMHNIVKFHYRRNNAALIRLSPCLLLSYPVSRFAASVSCSMDAPWDVSGDIHADHACCHLKERVSNPGQRVRAPSFGDLLDFFYHELLIRPCAARA